MRKIHLHGSLADFGAVHEMDVATAGEAIVALCSNFPKIEKSIREGSWVVLRGDPKTGMCLGEEAITGMRLGDADLHIMPEVMGAKNGDGVIKAILGVVLIVASFGAAPFLGTQIAPSILGATTWGNAIGQLGLAMALSGVSQMLAPEEESSNADDRSYTFTGPVSQQGQGHAVQIVYGEVITGGMLISGGVDADGLETVTEKPPTPTNPTVVETIINEWDIGP